MNFGKWDAATHETLDAIKRIRLGLKISDDSILSLDRDKATAIIAGSDYEPYSVTLSECTCVDFERRQLPCKHMYRLAAELGFDVSEPQFDPYAAYDYDVEEDIQRLKARWLAGQLTGDAFIKCADALHNSAGKAKRPRGRPKKV